MDAEPVLTVSEAATWLRVHLETIRVWLRQGKMQGYRPGGDKIGYRISAPEVERVLRRGATGRGTPT